jgi:RimJ/RimL family protein N-acetyltransferase
MEKILKIRPVTLEDVDAFTACAAAVIATNGKDGTPIFCGFDEVSPYSPEKKRDLYVSNLPKKTSELGWQRSWGIFDDDGIMYGDISLWTGDKNGTRHRAWLGMGLKPVVRGGGWGRKLMDIALNWAKNEPSIEYIDLCVFEGNDRAIALYEKFGFKKESYLTDRWRIQGRRMNEFLYSLNLETLR